MLSRVADALFWLSRYTERAENNARMLDVNLQLMLDVHPLANHQHWEPIIFSLEDTKLFNKRYPEITGDAVVDFVTFERKNPNSIYSCIATARENARTVREQISVEMWEQINRMYQNSTYEFFKWILESSHLFQGVTDATMAHDEGWEFIRLGMFLERADRTSRILDIKYHILLPSGEQIGGNVDTLQWMAVLKSCSALEPYRKHYRGQVVPWKVVEFLVKNQTFPRSIVFCVDSLDYSIHEITGVDRGDFQYKVEAERLSGRLLADLSFVTIDEIFRTGLHEYLDRMQGRLIEITKAIYKEFCEWLEKEDQDDGEQEETQPTQLQEQRT